MLRNTSWTFWIHVALVCEKKLNKLAQEPVPKHWLCASKNACKSPNAQVPKAQCLVANGAQKVGFRDSIYNILILRSKLQHNKLLPPQIIQNFATSASYQSWHFLISFFSHMKPHKYSTTHCLFVFSHINHYLYFSSPTLLSFYSSLCYHTV